MIRTAAFSLVLFASAAAAQAPRLVIRAAFLPITSVAVPDTAAMERAKLADGSAVYLGETLQTFGAGTLTDVRIERDPDFGRPDVWLTMTDAAAQAFARLTEARVGREIAYVLDGRALLAPFINSTITGGRVSIAGRFTAEEAKAIATAIRESAQVAEFDLTTPEAAALAIRRAAAASDWLTVARILHPTALHALRETFASSFVIAGDSVRASTARMYTNLDGTPWETDTLAWVSVRDVTGIEAPARLEDFSDEQAVALLYAGLFRLRPDYPDARAVTTFTDETGMAFVVLDPGPTTFRDDVGMAEAVVVQARRVGEEWRVFLPRGAW